MDRELVTISQQHFIGRTWAPQRELTELPLHAALFSLLNSSGLDWAIFHFVYEYSISNCPSGPTFQLSKFHSQANPCNILLTNKHVHKLLYTGFLPSIAAGEPANKSLDCPRLRPCSTASASDRNSIPRLPGIACCPWPP